MTLNKNMLWTSFFFLTALMSPELFKLLAIPIKYIPNITAVMYVLGATVLVYINRHTVKDNTLSNNSSKLSKIMVIGLLGIFLSWFLQTVLALIEIQVFNQPLGSQNTADITKLIKNSPFFMIAVTIAGPIMEEFVFRFSLVNFLNQKLNIWVSALISSLIFAALHGDGHYLIYGGLGMFFVYLYKKTGSILTSIITHAGMNTLVITLQLLFL